MKTHQSKRNFEKEKIEFGKILEYLKNKYFLESTSTISKSNYKAYKNTTLQVECNENLEDWVYYTVKGSQEATNPLFTVYNAKLDKTLCISFNHWLNREFEVEVVNNSHFVDIRITKLKSETIINLLKLFLL